MKIEKLEKTTKKFENLKDEFIDIINDFWKNNNIDKIKEKYISQIREGSYINYYCKDGVMTLDDGLVFYHDLCVDDLNFICEQFYDLNLEKINK